MKKIILALFINSIAISLTAQNYNTTIGIKLMPGISSVYHRPAGLGYLGSFSMNGGIVVGQRIFKDMLFIETGLFYFEKGISDKVLVTDEYGNPTGTLRFKEMNYFLSLPVSLIYKFKGFYVGAGLNINYYLTRRFVVDGKLITTEKISDLDNITFGAQFSLGYELKLPKQFLMTFDAYANPTFKYRYLNYGIGVGLKYIICKPKV